jgi:serine protease Do
MYSKLPKQLLKRSPAKRDGNNHPAFQWAYTASAVMFMSMLFAFTLTLSAQYAPAYQQEEIAMSSKTFTHNNVHISAGPVGFVESLSVTSVVDRLNTGNDANFGFIGLGIGFEPDPYGIRMTAGGSVNASYLPGSECYGFATASPDFKLDWNGSGLLKFYFEADSNEDTVLLINLPDGSWICNDDAYSGVVDPMVVIESSARGVYDIWVASYYEGEFVSGTLNISELPHSGPSGESASAGSKFSSLVSPSQGGTPGSGTINLRSGFTPDPAELSVVSGGVVNVSNLNLGPDCTGYADSTADVQLNWSGSTSDLRVFFESTDGDTILIIRGPNGRYICNDDAHAGTLNPMINLNQFGAGIFDIWVASYSEGSFHSGTLKITELDIRP